MGRRGAVSTGRIATWGCLWPGLPMAWRGSWRGLAAAVGFGWAVNLALATLLWPELVGATLRTVLWLTLGGAWLVGVLITARRQKRGLHEIDAPQQDLFQQALTEYLQRNWFKAENLLDSLVRMRPHDVDAKLMLVTLWRRTGRLNDARQGLAQLERWDNSAKWELEIGAERQLLDEQATEEAIVQPSGEEEHGPPLGQVA